MLDPHTTGQIIEAAIKIHRKLGPGLLESAYEACLAYELEQAGLLVQRQKAVPLVYNTVNSNVVFAPICSSTVKWSLRSSAKR